jgi:hypothetical protein
MLLAGVLADKGQVKLKAMRELEAKSPSGIINFTEQQYM